MRIAILGPFGLHPNKTMRSRAQRLGQELVDLGHVVEMIMPPWQTPDEADQVWVEDGVTLRYVGVNGGIIAIVRRMLKAVATFEPDVVYGFKPKAYSGLCMWWLWQKSIFGQQRPILITDTDDWEGWGGWNEIADYSTAQKYFFAWQETWGMAHCDLLTVASRELERRALDLGMPTKQLLYLPNGSGIRVDPRPTPDTIAQKRAELGLEDRPTLLLYSRLFEFDTDRLIQIMIAVQQAIPSIAFLMIGAGLFAEQAAEFRSQLERHNLLSSCVDVGWLAESELPETILAADVGLYLMDDTLLNRTKCPVKLADMVALGLPVVAEAVGQVTEYVQDGENGRLHKSGEISHLSQSIVQLLVRDSKASQVMKAAGVTHYKTQFAWKIQANRLLEEITALSESRHF